TVGRMTVTLVPYHQDERLPDSVFPLPGSGHITLTPEPNGDDVWSRLVTLYEPVAAEVASQAGGGTRPTLVSGDCIGAIAVIAGLPRAGLDPSIVSLAAHGA